MKELVLLGYLHKRELDRLRDITTQIQVGEGSLKDDAMFMSKLDRLEIKLTAAEYTELRTLLRCQQEVILDQNHQS